MEIPKKLFPMADHGWDPRQESGDNIVGICPFCLREKMYVNPETGQWKCHEGECQREGNIPTFLEQLAEFHVEHTTVTQLRKLADLRNIPVEILQDYGISWDGKRFLIPVRSPSGVVCDLRKYELGKTIRSTKGVKTGLLNADLIDHEAHTIVLCAGEFDTMTMDHILRENEIDMLAVGVPGEDTFKTEWVDLFRKKTVLIAYDNDEPGLRGMAKVGGCNAYPKDTDKLRDGLLRGSAKDIMYLKWSKSIPPGSDVNDLYKMLDLDAEEAWQLIREGTRPDHPRSQKSIKVKKKINKVSFADVIKVYSKWLLMDEDTVAALKVIYATVFSVKIPGDPVWVYLVGPSGIGKTVLLSSLNNCEEVIYRSNITPNTLVSGWKAKTDPSLIPQLNGKCFLLKDFTEIIAMGDMIKDEVYSILRGAYDGYVERSYGNGIHREYECHFSMVAGVTGAIQGEMARGAALGDRFLKYQMRKQPETIRAQVLKGIDSLKSEEEMPRALAEISYDFIGSRIDDVHLDNLSHPAWLRDKIAALVDLVCWVRGTVPRDFHRHVLYRPENEIGTRMGKQLIKLGWGHCIVEDKNSIDWSIYSLLRRVAFDTAEGFNFEIVKAAMAHGGLEVSFEDLAGSSGLPKDTIRDKLDDLVILKVMYQKRSRKAEGSFKMQSKWSVNRLVRKLWTTVESESEIEI